MAENIEKDKEKETKAQILPIIPVVVASPLFWPILTIIGKSIISFLMGRWLRYFFPKKKKEKDESIQS